MRKYLFIVGTAAVLAGSTVISLDAQRAGGPRRGGPAPDAAAAGPEADAGGPGRSGRGQFGPGVRLMNLTDDQQRAVRDIVQKTRDEVGPIADQLELARKNLHREVFADTRDTAKVTALASQVSALEKQIFDAQLQSRSAIAALLTPEQRRQARTTMREPGRFGPGMGTGMRRGDGPRPGQAPAARPGRRG